MLVCEGVGRTLSPELNMWELARPLIEEWTIAHRGPGARAQAAIEAAMARIEELPQFVGNLEKAAAMLASGGVRLHPDSIAALGQSRGAWWPWVIAVLALAAAVAVLA
jgi:ubiquinone biosynthesis protein